MIIERSILTSMLDELLKQNKVKSTSEDVWAHKKSLGSASTGSPTNRPFPHKLCVFPEEPESVESSLLSLVNVATCVCAGWDCSRMSLRSTCQMRDTPLSLSLHSSSPPVLPVISVAAGDIWTTVTVDTVGWRALTNPHGPQKTGGGLSLVMMDRACACVCVCVCVGSGDV